MKERSAAYLTLEQVVVDGLGELGDELGVANVVEVNVLHVAGQHVVDGHATGVLNLLRVDLGLRCGMRGMV